MDPEEDPLIQQRGDTPPPPPGSPPPDERGDDLRRRWPAGREDPGNDAPEAGGPNVIDWDRAFGGGNPAAALAAVQQQAEDYDRQQDVYGPRISSASDSASRSRNVSATPTNASDDHDSGHAGASRGNSNAYMGRDWEMRTVSDAIDAMGYGAYQRRVFWVCGMALFSLAFETGAVVVLFPVLKEEWTLSRTQLTALGSCTYFGMMLGALLLGRLGDRIGRRPVFQIGLFISALFGLASAFSPSIEWFVTWRFMLGFGYGGQMISSVCLLAEYLPTRERGTMLVLLDLFFSAGTAAAVLLGWYVIVHVGWRYMVGISSVPGFVVVFLRGLVPESPQFTIIRRDRQLTVSLLQDVAHVNGVSRALQKKIGELQPEHEEAEPPSVPVKVGFGTLFNPLLQLTALVLIALWFVSAAAGSVFFWLPVYVDENSVVSRSSHVLLNDSYRATLVMTLGEVVGVLVAAAYTAKFQRRNLLRILYLMACASIVALGFMVSAVQLMLSMLPLIGALRSVIVALLYVYTPEVLPTSARMTGVGLCTAFGRLAPATAYWIVLALTHVAFMHVASGFATLYLLAFVLTFMLPGDTKDRPMGFHYYQEVSFLQSSRDEPGKDDYMPEPPAPDDLPIADPDRYQNIPVADPDEYQDEDDMPPPPPPQDDF